MDGGCGRPKGSRVPDVDKTIGSPEPSFVAYGRRGISQSAREVSELIPMMIGDKVLAFTACAYIEDKSTLPVDTR